ncbi:fasciclin-like arabinogalactan protein 1 [Tripterygium wilfordii]|uniref:Fasciclin-like arabinogalactan protein 1 n=1 Tax=Tripterygium wilfordii TaxID=458696 RepID=A0A7J7C8J5_TRIWF|nr:fasciclin-like arabinogalactan protein 1 [Tripterygium wilfordii]KAF5730471.1 fasciclin-like arabinogalactan protein 1 [Tripterygium wilfordii]
MEVSRVLSVLLLLTISYTTQAHNITRLLAKHPSFSTFNHYLTLTHLAPEINSRTTITVCAIDNAAMSELLDKHLSLYTLKNILSMHVLLDYFGSKKLHQITNGTALAATMFQATGSAPGSSGFVNITDLKGGKVGFGTAAPDGADLNVFYVKSLEEVPYNISVIQISKVLESDVAEAPAPGPAQMNLTGIMSAHGCKVFADTLLANPEASKTYQDNIDGGLTVFCPLDDPFKAFLPKFKNLSAPGKASFLEFFGVPVYQSLSMLKSNNGLMNTLATDGASKFDLTVQNDGEQVTLKTKSTTARITGTLIDEQPLAIYTIDKVLLPKELFKGAPTPAPAPAPEKAADAPKSSKDAPSSDSAPADSPDDVADQAADNNAGIRYGSGRVAAITLSLFLGLLLL